MASVLPLRAAGADRELYLAGCRLSDGRMAAAIFDDAGDILSIEPLQARAHGAAVSPDRTKAVLFARRPGRFALVIDIARRRRSAAFAPPEDRRFAGHGAFSGDGRVLYAAENDFDGERGVIGLYGATAGFTRLGEFETHGIGPHEICLLADGKTIAVANGGIATHPDFPRMKLNLPTMRPSLALIDATDGDLIVKADLPEDLHQLSIRHMAQRGSGEIWFGAQYEGAPTDEVPLVGTFDEQRGLRFVDGGSDRLFSLRQYVGSVAVSRDGATAITTSPRGGVALEWDTRTREVRAVHHISDVCGAAPWGGRQLLLTSGSGAIAANGIGVGRLPVAWDNHATALGNA